MARIKTTVECPGCGAECGIVGWRVNGAACFLVCSTCESIWLRRGHGCAWRLPDVSLISLCLSRLPVDELDEDDMRDLLTAMTNMARMALRSQRLKCKRCSFRSECLERNCASMVAP